MTQNPYIQALHVGDLVFVPVDKQVLAGKIIDEKWKVNGQWVIVEVQYADMTGKLHTTTLKPMRPDKLTRRGETTS